MKTFVNCDVYTGEIVLHQHAVVVRNGIIDDIRSHDRLPTEGDIIDLKGQTLAPGFIDVQVNGGGGVLFNDAPTACGIRQISDAHLKFGTTSLLPTLITDTTEKMLQAAQAVNESINEGNKSVIGIHFEGPALSQGKAGVHNKKRIRQLSDADIQALCSLNTGVTLVTLAPETASEDVVRRLDSKGIRLSLGHTDITADVANRYKAAGVRCVTHLHNAMSAFGSREPGLVGWAMADRDIWAGIIVDGHHVHFESVRASWNAKRDARMFLVTDAMPPVGSPIDKFALDSLEIYVKDGRCVTAEGVLGGSALDMATAVRNCIQKVGIPKDEALRMASTYPAHFLGRQHQYGVIREGAIANLVVLTNEIHVSQVFQAGERAY